MEKHNEAGVKYDNGKPLAGDMIRIFPHALMGVAKCIEWGSHKYPQTDNYIRLENGYERYMNGLMRHLLKIQLGQQYDDETLLPHIFHVCWNCLAICEHWFKELPEKEKEKVMEGLLMPYDKYFSENKVFRGLKYSSSTKSPTFLSESKNIFISAQSGTTKSSFESK